ncbi:MAG: PHP domain-containing protein, partial [Oligoflexales bacterium]|nr:PHP domain-containing protein [Oligoflexales bacterium]
MASLVEDIGWNEWICHTNFSFKLGASHPHEIISKAVEQQYRGLCIADFDGVYGLARSYTSLKKIKTQDPTSSLKLFYAAEIHFAKDHDLPLIQQDTLVLLALSHRGYYSLCKLLSYAHRDGKSDAYIPLEYLASSDLQDLVAIQPMRGLIHRRDGEKHLRQKCELLRQAFGKDNFYLTVSRLLNEAEDSAILPTLKLTKQLELKCLLSQDAFFHAAEMKNLSDLLHAIRVNKPIGQALDHIFVNAERCLHSLKGIDYRYRTLPIYKSAL